MIMKKLIKSVNNVMLWVVPALVIIAGIMLTVHNYSEQKDSIEYLSSWEPTLAIITERTNILYSNGYIDYEFTYVVDGKEYTGEQRLKRRVGRHKNAHSYHVGDPQVVWYDPSNPENVSLQNPSPWLSIFLPLILAPPIAFLAMGFYGCFFVWNKSDDDSKDKHKSKYKHKHKYDDESEHKHKRKYDDDESEHKHKRKYDDDESEHKHKRKYDDDESEYKRKRKYDDWLQNKNRLPQISGSLFFCA